MAFMRRSASLSSLDASGDFAYASPPPSPVAAQAVQAAPALTVDA